jgi:hypothetical protein
MLKYGEPPIADANTGRIPGEPFERLGGVAGPVAIPDVIGIHAVHEHWSTVIADRRGRRAATRLVVGQRFVNRFIRGVSVVVALGEDCPYPKTSD